MSQQGSLGLWSSAWMLGPNSCATRYATPKSPVFFQFSNSSCCDWCHPFRRACVRPLRPRLTGVSGRESTFGAVSR